MENELIEDQTTTEVAGQTTTDDAAPESVLTGIIEQFQDAFSSISQSGGIASSIAIFMFFLFIIFMAALASTIAEKKKQNPFGHFCIGLIIPVVYPLLAKMFLKSPEEESENQNVEAEETVDNIIAGEAPPVAIKATKDKTTVDETKLVNEAKLIGEESMFNQSYFKDLAYDEQGRPRGPFDIMIGEIEMRVEQIVDPQEDLVIIESYNADGKLQSLRIPYRKIESCREV
ncbi:MAG: hypothetical protein MK193_00685 [Lentisphaeria bacterium]|nr:hypothetical protein [Lentisphaeria bacterium]